jgi:glucose/arabinose dehydrogenase
MIAAADPAVSKPPMREAETVARGFLVPTSFAFQPNGRILVAEQRGVVRLVDRGRLRPAPFLDLRARVNTFNERGLMAIAVRGGSLYAYYALETNRREPKAPTGMRLSRFRIEGDRARASSEVVLLGRESRAGCAGSLERADCIPANCGCHVGGDIQFARDGTIFLSTGDAANAGFANASAVRSQHLDSLAGKLLHVSPSGAGLRTNPFWSGRAAANRSKVWALGLRNPFRFRLDPRSGMPVVGDVGWLDREEIDVAVRGSNLGWPCYEGDRVQPRYRGWAECVALYRRRPRRLRAPAYTYPRGRGAGVVGGAFSPAGALGGRYPRAYFFADYVRGWIRTVNASALLGGRRVQPRAFARGIAGPVELAFGPDGALYYLAAGTGRLHRIVARAG